LRYQLNGSGLLGHLGEDTVDHTAYHLPIIIEELLNSASSTRNGQKLDPEEIANILRRSISSFDEAIVKDVLDLIPGGIEGLSKLSNEHISNVINDGGENYKKTKLCMYGTTVLVALVDPARENLWIANLGDCQGGTLRMSSSVQNLMDLTSLVLVNANGLAGATAEVLTRMHNGTSNAEIARLLREHPGEPGCVSDGRVLGVIAPFRCEFCHRSQPDRI
jgi:pyruvate dehydrogenase phosphatase